MKRIKLFETYKSQKELEILSQEITKKASEKIFKKYNEKEDKINSIPPIRLKEIPLKYKSRVTIKDEYDRYNEIENFIKNSNTWIYFVNSNHYKSTAKGDFYYDNSFNSRQIRIYVKKETFEDLNQEKNTAFDILEDTNISEEEKREEFNKNMYRFHFYKYESVILHELQHSYDHWRSKGKAFNVDKKFLDKKKKFINIMNTDKARFLSNEQLDFIEDYQKIYLNLKHEVDARFAQAIKEVDMLDVDDEHYKKYNKLVVTIKPFEKVFKEFVRNMKGYSELTKEEKRRVHKKLGQFYELEKEFIKDMNKRNKNVSL